jgi:hypothetical protein
MSDEESYEYDDDEMEETFEYTDDEGQDQDDAEVALGKLILSVLCVA